MGSPSGRTAANAMRNLTTCALGKYVVDALVEEVVDSGLSLFESIVSACTEHFKANKEIVRAVSSCNSRRALTRICQIRSCSIELSIPTDSACFVVSLLVI